MKVLFTLKRLSLNFVKSEAWSHQTLWQLKISGNESECKSEIEGDVCSKHGDFWGISICSRVFHLSRIISTSFNERYQAIIHVSISSAQPYFTWDLANESQAWHRSVAHSLLRTLLTICPSNSQKSSPDTVLECSELHVLPAAAPDVLGRGEHRPALTWTKPLADPSCTFPSRVWLDQGAAALLLGSHDISFNGRLLKTLKLKAYERRTSKGKCNMRLSVKL